MANKIILKKSSVPSKVPTTSDLVYGELALNYSDGLLYFKDSTSPTPNIRSFVAADINGSVPYATALFGGSANQLVYQTSSQSTGYVTSPTTNYFLKWDGSSYTWSNTIANASNATNATNASYASAIAFGDANRIPYNTGASATSFIAAPTVSDTVLTWNGSSFVWSSISSGSGGTVTSVSVTSANGFAGSVATSTTTPAITISTSITGLLKGNGTAISAATAETDYVTPTGSGTLTNKTLTAGTTYFQDQSDNTKKIQFGLGSVGANSTRVVTFLDSDGTIVLESTTQTLTNKTLSDPVLSGTTTLSGSSIITSAAVSGSSGSVSSDSTYISTGNTSTTGSPTSVYSGNNNIGTGGIAINGTLPSSVSVGSVILYGGGLSYGMGTMATGAHITVQGGSYFGTYYGGSISINGGYSSSGANYKGAVNIGTNGDTRIVSIGTTLSTLSGTFPDNYGSNGQVLTTNGSGTLSWATVSSGSGTVTSVSVTSANGFAGSVATSTTTPAITISTSITGLLKGNGTAISAATAETDYVTPTGSGTLTNKTLTSPTINTSVLAGSSSINLFNTTATTLNIGGAATAVSLGASSGTTTVNNNLTVTGNLTVNGTTTTVNSTTITVDDITLELGSVAVPSDVTAAGGGIVLRGATDKSITWGSTNGWTSTEDLNVASGKVYRINGTSVLSSNTLGSGVTASSLTSVGTITSGTWSGSFGAVSGANLTNLTAGNLSGTIPSAVLGNSTVYVGTTAVTLNRSSANLALTGISSVTLPGSTSGTSLLQAQATAGTTTFTLPTTTGTLVGTGDSGTVTSTMIADGTIVNGDISASAAIAISKLAASTISGVSLGSNLNLLTIGTGLSGTSYNGSSAVTIAVDSTVALRADTHYIGTTAVALNRASANLALTGISSVTLPGSTSGSVQVIPTATAGTGTILTLPATTGTVITTGDTGTVTSTMIADGTIVNGDISSSAAIAISKLASSTISGVSLGSNLNTLTISTGLSGTSYNGSGAVTIAIDSTVTTLTGTQTLTNKTLTNPVINNVKLGINQIATAAGTTTLTVTSNHQQRFTGTSTQTVVMPVTSTLVAGMTYAIENASTGNITINSSGGNLIATVIPGTTVDVTCIGTTLTTAADWDAEIRAFSSSNSIIPTANLGTGTANSTTYLRGDQTWQTISAGGLSTTDDNTTNASYYPVFVTTAGGSTAKTASTQLTFNPSTGTMAAILFNSLSDESRKDDITTIKNAVETVNQLHGVEFKWKDNGYKSSGVIAQQIEQILPHLVTESDGLKSVNYSGLIGYLIESIKELNQRINVLENN